MDILTNVTKPTSGWFKINYQKHLNNQNSSPKNVQKIGICYQHEILYEDLSIEQHMYFYARIKNIQTDK